MLWLSSSLRARRSSSDDDEEDELELEEEELEDDSEKWKMSSSLLLISLLPFLPFFTLIFGSSMMADSTGWAANYSWFISCGAI